MVCNGVVRVLLLQPRLGHSVARQASCLLGMGAILAISASFVRRLDDPTPTVLFRIGVLWLALTLAFELLFGHYVSGVGWEMLLADYDLLAGRLWPLVLLTTLLAPWLCGRVHKSRRGS